MRTPFPCLWFDGKAEEAAKFYASLLPGSSVDKVWRSPADTPSGPAGMVLTVDFTLNGQHFQGLNGGPDFSFNEASRARAGGSRTDSACRGRSCRAS
jgi:predicted 3-demethylubiquinone-9 3-methyltransferase (glyoxalase superfamily)